MTNLFSKKLADILNIIAKFLPQRDALNVKLCNKMCYDMIKFYSIYIKSSEHVIDNHANDYTKVLNITYPYSTYANNKYNPVNLFKNIRILHIGNMNMYQHISNHIYTYTPIDLNHLVKLKELTIHDTYITDESIRKCINIE